MTNIIEVKNLTKKFDDFVAVKDVSFSVEEGNIFAFLGPNGAGKSTTIKMLTTLLHPTSGSLSINGFDPMKEPDKVRHSFGIVFQDPSLDEDLTALENLQLHGVLYHVPKNILKKRIDEMLALVELLDRRNDFVRDFSGGMKRRLEIARGLLHHPKIMFLDEPTLGLDPQTRNHLWSYVQKLNSDEGITVFFTTHYMEEADRIAKNIAIIDHGVIIAQGSSEELQKQTSTTTLEEAFLKLTGSAIRDELGSSTDRMRSHYHMRHGGGRR
ncbi:MAG: ATP-binding cassette domain-containing protein [Candidatus Kaiserbacteria bacterium]|nr:ATP-binding cassette domain-containing protein [Candidatus Kaiserbacteria bacterium]